MMKDRIDKENKEKDKEAILYDNLEVKKNQYGIAID